MQKPEIELSLIGAMTQEGIIGRNNELPWYIPSDLARFKKKTTEIGIMVMGRKTYGSILARNNGALLPSRHHIVLSRTCSFQDEDSLTTVASVEDACAAVKAHGGRAIVIGGAEIYKLFMPLVRTAYITVVHTPPEMPIRGDAFFPPMRLSNWACTDIPSLPRDDRDEYPTTLYIYERVSPL
ncbi:MAG: dihydrofolate reductase [Minisyncoccia bacterium]